MCGTVGRKLKNRENIDNGVFQGVGDGGNVKAPRGGVKELDCL